jgi:hypothetical protein
MIDESRMVADVNLGGKWYGVFYHPAGRGVFSAERIQRAVAVFDSRPVVLSSDVTSWKEVSWASTAPGGTSLRVYVRTASDEASLASAAWCRPLLNGGGEDISGQTGRALQFRIAMSSGYDPSTGAAQTPSVSSFAASCYVRGDAQAFYTAAVPLGFVPSHVLLTYNGTIPDDAIVEFSVAAIDSTDSKDFKVIRPNTVEGVEEIAKSTMLKVCVSAVGNTEIPFVIDEFAVAVGGPSFSVLQQ